MARLCGCPYPDLILRGLPDWLLEEWEEYFEIDGYTGKVDRAYALAQVVSRLPIHKKGDVINPKDFMTEYKSKEPYEGIERTAQSNREKTTSDQWNAFFAGYGVGTAGKEEH